MEAHSLVRLRRVVWALVLGGALGPLVGATPAQTIPARLDDATFWRMMNEMSEPWGVFRSENFVSNETSYQWIIPELLHTVKPGNVYLGVAPDQNFTYIVAMQPSIAFIVDIRHQNAMQHLMYKALMETSATRAEFLSKLFARPALRGVDTSSTVVALFNALANTRPDSALYRDNLVAIVNQLTVTHGFALSDSERVSLQCVYGAFFSQGPTLTYNYGSECRNTGGFSGGMPGGGGYRGGGGGFGDMPSYLGMMTEMDGEQADHGYLASEAHYRALKTMEERNLIVPLTGDFAGDKTLRGVGQYVRDRGATIGAFYVSNVEPYLFMQDDAAARFYRSVSTLPVDASSTFIRSYSMGGRGGFGGQVTLNLKQQSGRSVQLISPILEMLKAFEGGQVSQYVQVIALSHQ
ncbi:hypothetical protein BH11GEM1_BH11GEM1_36850 [soil metagenome]